jgi:tetratricopeptide (TPR) repeat protein
MSDARLALTSGDFLKAAQDGANAIALHGPSPIQSLSDPKALAEIGAHDIAAARATMRDPDTFGMTPGFSGLTDIATRMWIDSEAEDWMAVLSRAEAVDLLVSKYPGVRTSVPTMVTPLIAYAQARLKDFTAAEKSIAQTPGNCYLCLRIRARIAELRGQYARADYWFARALRAGPSLPFVPAEWGQTLLARGKPDAAIANFKLAIQKGPHFADPLEGWGEALMAKDQSHLALAKFAEAEKYAPNWGRLHLKWGEALVYSGKKDEAKAQFTRAAQLDLTPSEKSELARHL